MTLPRDPADDLDRLLDDGAGELGSLYRRLPRVEPPKRLDRSVLGEAARAVRSRPPRHHGWMVGVGSAAGVVLAAGIAWQVGRNVAQQQTTHDAFHGASSVVPVEPITDAPARRREHARDVQNSMAKQAPASPPAGPAQEAAAQAQVRKPEPRPAAAAKSALPPAAMNAAAPPPAVAAPQAPAAFAPEDKDKHLDRLEQEKTTTGAGEADAVGADSKQRLQNAVVTGGKLDAKKEEDSTVRAVPAPSGSVELRRDMQLAPDEWIAHIRELVRQGRRQQALESLRLLRRMHPDVVVPAKLRALED